MIIGGLDCGQKVDHSVLTTLREGSGIDADEWGVSRVTKVPLGLSFKRQQKILQPELDELDMLIIDAGGTGQGWAETISGARLTKIVPAVIIGGTSKGRLVKGRVSVGKTYLVTSMLNMLSQRWLVIDPAAPGREILREEMANFMWAADGRNRKAEAAKGFHDDAVMSAALAAFLARTLARESK
nr:hypothetical protein [uncultured Ruegeria sp.]